MDDEIFYMFECTRCNFFVFDEMSFSRCPKCGRILDNGVLLTDEEDA